MKKRYAALAMVAAATIVLSGCSTGAAPAPNPGATNTEKDAKLLIWVDSVREPAAKAYQESVKGKVDVTIQVVDTKEIVTKITLFNTTQSGWPDIAFTGLPNDVATLSAPDNGYAADLSKIVPKTVLDSYHGANQWCQTGDKVYCLKNDLAQSVLWYNTKLFKQLGLTVPTTMDEFAAEAMKLKGTGYVAGAIGDNLPASFLQPSGCPVAEVKNATTIISNPDAVECTRVAKLLQPLVDAKVLDTRSEFDAGYIKDVAKQDKIVMAIGPSWFGDFIMKPENTWGIPAGEMTAAPMPKWDGNDKAYSGEAGGGIWMMSSHTKFPQTAAAAVGYLATNVDLMKDAVTFPASKPAFEAWAKRIGDDPYYAASPIPAMVAQATLINPVVKPVRFAIGSPGKKVLGTQLAAGTPIDQAVRAYMDAVAKLAATSGYKVDK